mgnify:CR=1 FL=1
MHRTTHAQVLTDVISAVLMEATNPSRLPNQGDSELYAAFKEMKKADAGDKQSTGARACAIPDARAHGHP